MKAVKGGNKVKILCEARLEDGALCYKTEKEKPLELVVGQGKFFPAVENELKDMKEGATKTITVEDAFGSYHNDFMIEVPREAFRPDTKLEVGTRVKITGPTGKEYNGTIAALNEKNLTLDLNHPLAGKRILFTITIVSIS